MYVVSLLISNSIITSEAAWDLVVESSVCISSDSPLETRGMSKSKFAKGMNHLRIYGNGL